MGHTRSDSGAGDASSAGIRRAVASLTRALSAGTSALARFTRGHRPTRRHGLLGVIVSVVTAMVATLAIPATAGAAPTPLVDRPPSNGAVAPDRNTPTTSP